MYINQLRSRVELKLDLINTTFYRSIADSELKHQVLDPLSSLSSTLTWVGTQSPRRLRLSYNNHRADYVSCRSRVNRLSCLRTVALLSRLVECFSLTCQTRGRTTQDVVACSPPLHQRRIVHPSADHHSHFGSYRLSSSAPITTREKQLAKRSLT